MRGLPSCLRFGRLGVSWEESDGEGGVLQGYSGPSSLLGPLLSSCVNSIRRKALLLAGNLNIFPQYVSFRHFVTGVVNAPIIPQSDLCPSGV